MSFDKLLKNIKDGIRPGSVLHETDLDESIEQKRIQELDKMLYGEGDDHIDVDINDLLNDGLVCGYDDDYDDDYDYEDDIDIYDDDFDYDDF